MLIWERLRVDVTGFEPTTLRHQPNKISSLQERKQVRRRCGVSAVLALEVFSMFRSARDRRVYALFLAL